MSRDTADSQTIDLFTGSAIAPASRAPFMTPLARITDPETSKAAATLAAFKATKNRMIALATLREFGPLTDFELAEKTGIQQTSIGKRRGECVAAGLAAPQVSCSTGKPLTRPAPSGASAMVWRITDAGLDYLRKAEEQ